MIKGLIIFLAVMTAAFLGVRFFFLAPRPHAPAPVEKTVLALPQPAEEAVGILPQTATTTRPSRAEEPSDKEKEKHQILAVPVLPLPSVSVSLPLSVMSPAEAPHETAPLSPATSTPAVLSKPPLPPLNLKAIFAAVVKIECPSEDRKGKYVGSGFVLPGNGNSIITAAHLLMVSGSDACTVIFPNKDRAPSHWLQGSISEDRAAVRKRHDEEGIDVATIVLPTLSEYPEARAVFPDAYPSIPYPVCEDPDMIGDTLMHFGYPSNFLNQSYLSVSDGAAIAYADIKGIETLLNQDQTDSYKSPIFSYVTDRYNLHPYMVSRVPSFYGDSGGLAFNATKQCILGPQRGGTIGGGAGENISIFPLLGWPAAKSLLTIEAKPL